MTSEQPIAIQPPTREGEQGFLLLGVIVMVAILLIALSVAAPSVAKDLRRQQELEAVHRGQQYVRAVRLYHLKTNAYPGDVKQLDNTNNERYLRRHYINPLTGKDDWKLIAVGQNKTTVKGLFGQPLGGLPTTGLGSASGLSSGIGSPIGGNAGGNVSGAVGAVGTVGGASGTGDSGSATGGSSFGSSSFGQSGTGAGGTGIGSTGTGGAGTNGTGTTGNGTNGTGSDSPFGSGGGSPFIGVGIPKDGSSIITLNEQTDYSTWEFIYDPRVEQLFGKNSIFGGGIATSTGGLGSASGLSSTTGGGSTAPGSTAPGSTTPGSTTPGTTDGANPGTGTTGTTGNPPSTPPQQ